MEFITYSAFGIVILATIIAGILLPALAIKLYGNYKYGIAIICALAFFEALFPQSSGVSLGINLYPADLITATLMLVALLRLFLQPIARIRSIAWYIFVLSFAISLTIGLSTFGTAAGVSARSYFYAIATCTYALTFTNESTQPSVTLTSTSWLAVAFMVVVVVRWAITYIPITSMLPPEGRFASSEASLLRVISSGEAIVIAQVAVVGLFYPTLLASWRWIRLLIPPMILMIVALQHRSVWLAFASGIGLRFTLPQKGRRAFMRLAAVLATAIALLAPMALSGFFSEATQDITKSATRAAALSDTATARLDSWEFLFDKWATSKPSEVILGLPMGTSMERVLTNVNGSKAKVNWQAHNFYIQTLFNTGILGLLSIMAVYVYAMIGLFKGLKHPTLGDAAGALLLIIFIQAVYYIPYGINYLQGALLGTALALAPKFYKATNRRRIPGHAQSLLSKSA